MAIERRTKGALLLTGDQGWSLRVAPGDDFLLGRGQEPPIPSITTDRKHARVRYQDGTCTLEDLGSTSGTWLNGSIIHEPHPLHTGDVFRIGQFEVTVSEA